MTIMKYNCTTCVLRTHIFHTPSHNKIYFIIINIILSCNMGHKMVASTTVKLLMEKSPESTIAPLQDEVLFECKVNIVPEQLNWRFRQNSSKGITTNFENLINNSTFNITTEEKTTKLRVNVRKNSIGDYQCIAWFGTTALVSVAAKLSLATISTDDLPQHIIHRTVYVGNSLFIKCGNVTSNPPAEWSFYKNNNPVETTIPQLLSGTLILESVTKGDSGLYSCVAINSITGKEVKLPYTTNLKVIETTERKSPYFLSTNPIQPQELPPRNYSTLIGTSVLLGCPAIGNPTPKAVWSRPDYAISDSRTSVHDYGLKITNATPDDAGIYVCRLDNGIAPVLIHSIKLDILEPPEIIDGVKPSVVNETDSLDLECITKGFPRPKVYWMINGKNMDWDSLIYSNGSRFFIKSVEKRHAGIVQCFAQNEIGEVSESGVLRVTPKQINSTDGLHLSDVLPGVTFINFDNTRQPSNSRNNDDDDRMIPPSRPTITRLSDEKVMVRWNVKSRKESLKIQFFKVQYRILADLANNVQRSSWMTSNEDIPPNVRLYEVDNLNPGHYYRFRMAAVYSNNDNKLSNVSRRFLLQRGSKLDPIKTHLAAPNLTRIEIISETSVILHWLFPTKPLTPVTGFYAYYRPASTAGEYNKATVAGMKRRQLRLDYLESGTVYEFKIQSFTSSAASEFSPIITGKTLKASTPPTVVYIQTISSETNTDNATQMPLIIGTGVGAGFILLVLICMCLCIRRRRISQHDTNDNKSHSEHQQVDQNGRITIIDNNDRDISETGHMPITTRFKNGSIARINITSNPLAQENNKNRRTMDRNNQYNIPPVTTTFNDVIDTNQSGLPPSLGRTTSEHTSTIVSTSSPKMPRSNNDLLLNRSPFPSRAVTKNYNKKNRLGRAENISSGSLNSIEV